MKIIIHGGLLEGDSLKQRQEKRDALCAIVMATYKQNRDKTSREAAVDAVGLLEDNLLFNAGTGSMLQADGKIRMSAAVMEGSSLTFSGIINIEMVRNPIFIADRLQSEEDKVLSGSGAKLYATVHGFEEASVETAARREEFETKSGNARRGTVGCVAIDDNGTITAATSTGGKGMELVGRVSDSATVAGNYANTICGVSCTGIGEDIVNNATAAKIVTRVSDGMSLEDAVGSAVDELRQYNGEAGIIAIDCNGAIAHDYSRAEAMLAFASYDGRELLSFEDR